MSRTLVMVFQNEAGKNVSINIPRVKDNLSDQDVKNVMQTILSKNIFTSIGGDLVSIVSAQVVNKETEEFIVK